MRVLCIDPGLNKTGSALFVDGKLVAVNAWRSDKQSKAEGKIAWNARRTASLAAFVRQEISESTPDLAIVESGAHGAGKTVGTTAIRQMATAWATVIAVCGIASTNVHAVRAVDIRRRLKAKSKRDVHRMVKSEHPSAVRVAALYGAAQEDILDACGLYFAAPERAAA